MVVLFFFPLLAAVGLHACLGMSILFLQPDGTLSEVVATFTTDAKGEIRVSGVMDGIYTLHESKAPEGYDLAEDITFTVKDAKMLVNGGIVEVIMVNDPKIEIPPKPPVPPTAAR